MKTTVTVNQGSQVVGEALYCEYYYGSCESVRAYIMKTMVIMNHEA